VPIDRLPQRVLPITQIARYLSSALRLRFVYLYAGRETLEPIETAPNHTFPAQPGSSSGGSPVPVRPFGANAFIHQGARAICRIVRKMERQDECGFWGGTRATADSEVR
jgi:hypothetical protein